MIKSQNLSFNASIGITLISTLMLYNALKKNCEYYFMCFCYFTGAISFKIEREKVLFFAKTASKHSYIFSRYLEMFQFICFYLNNINAFVASFKLKRKWCCFVLYLNFNFETKKKKLSLLRVKKASNSECYCSPTIRLSMHFKTKKKNWNDPHRVDCLNSM